MDLLFPEDFVGMGVFHNCILFKTLVLLIECFCEACALEFMSMQRVVQEPAASESPETWRKSNSWSTPHLGGSWTWVLPEVPGDANLYLITTALSHSITTPPIL